MEVNRIQIMKFLLEIINDLTDKEYQKRIWIRGEGPEVDSFDDAVCNFFDTADHVVQNHKDYKLTNEQYQILKKFRDRYDLFCDDNDFPEEFIDSPEWAEIIAHAKEVLKAFDYNQKS